MIKFGMDSMQNENSSPRVVLDIINRIVEESVDDSMFISMFYGKYDAVGLRFSMLPQAMNQHYYIKASEDTFIELDAQGLTSRSSTKCYIMKNISVVLEEGDFIAMMTDGVTETRTEDGFIDEGTN